MISGPIFSSPEPKAPDVLLRSLAVHCRPSVSSVYIFSSKTQGPMFSKIHVEPSVKGRLKFFTNGYSPLIKIVPMPTYVKTLKNLILTNQESYRAELVYIALGTKGLSNFFKDDHTQSAFYVNLYQAVIGPSG